MFIFTVYHLERKVKCKLRREMICMKKILYAIMVIASAFFLVNVGVSEEQALQIIPDKAGGNAA